MRLSLIKVAISHKVTTLTKRTDAAESTRFSSCVSFSGVRRTQSRMCVSSRSAEFRIRLPSRNRRKPIPAATDHRKYTARPNRRRQSVWVHEAEPTAQQDGHSASQRFLLHALHEPRAPRTLPLLVR